MACRQGRGVSFLVGKRLVEKLLVEKLAAYPSGPRRAWSHLRNSSCSAWCEVKPADSREYRHLKSVRRRTSCAVNAARTPTLASLALRAGIAVGLASAPPVVPSSVISSPVVG